MPCIYTFPFNVPFQEKYVFSVKIKITLQLYFVKEMTLSMHLSHTWDITLEQIGTLLPPPTTLRRSLFLFNLYYHIKIYLPPISIKIFPDSGASICLAGIDYLSQLHLLHSDLTPCQKKVTAIGGSTLLCKRWLPMHLTIINQTTIQPLYFCLQLFPYPMLTAKKQNKKKNSKFQNLLHLPYHHALKLPYHHGWTKYHSPQLLKMYPNWSNAFVLTFLHYL